MERITKLCNFPGKNAENTQNKSKYVSLHDCFCIEPLVNYRYRAIWFPFERHGRNLRNKVIICGIWVMAGLVSAIQLGVAEARPFKYDNRYSSAFPVK